MQKWLQSLKAGQQVIIVGDMEGDKIARVVYVDDTIIIVEDWCGEMRFRRDGKQPGFSFIHLVKATPKRLASTKPSLGERALEMLSIEIGERGRKNE